jgi:hypothetical protein
MGRTKPTFGIFDCFLIATMPTRSGKLLWLGLNAANFGWLTWLLSRPLSNGGGHMIKTLLAIAVLGSAGGFAGLAMAQSKQGETFGNDVSAVLARLEAQCAHRRRMLPPDERDDCARRLRDAQQALGQGNATASNASAGQADAPGPDGKGNGNGGGPGNGIGGGPGGGGGPGNGIGPGSGGGGKGKR